MYIPSLDGIRAISFFLIFFAHAGLGKVLVTGGFGVTIFFLLSGFLITTLLRMEYLRFKRISLKDFYLRRALRRVWPIGPVFTSAAGIVRALIFAVFVHYIVERPRTEVRKRLSKVQSI
jgi:peptidoglycan/LPS O-acetylase OafA/YrhL